VTLALFSPSHFSAILQLSDLSALISYRKSRPCFKKNARTMAGTTLYLINPTKFSPCSSLALSKNGRFHRLAALLKALLEVRFLEDS
jgi:hypothetical protein